MSLETIVVEVNQRLEANILDAVVDTHDMMTDRIFNELKDRDGNGPKPYSTKPLWTTELPRKAGERRGKKSYYFEGGYAQLKKEVGRPPLQLFGNLFKDFSTGLVEVNKNNYRVVVSEENANKIQGNFENFFRINKDEIEFLNEKLVREAG